MESILREELLGETQTPAQSQKKPRQPRAPKPEGESKPKTPRVKKAQDRTAQTAQELDDALKNVADLSAAKYSEARDSVQSRCGPLLAS